LAHAVAIALPVFVLTLFEFGKVNKLMNVIALKGRLHGRAGLGRFSQKIGLVSNKD
jgi:hypothetical protein